MPSEHILLDRMVRDLSERQGIRDAAVLEAIRSVPRHEFVPPHLRTRAYGDHALPIGSSQTISQPFVVARMTELLQVGKGHSVLEIGTGSGYQTAILARLARVVYSLERISKLSQEAIARMRELGIGNVKIQTFDGTVGWSRWAPYDRVIVTAASERVPEPLLDQLAVGGRLVAPEGSRDQQRLVVYVKRGESDLERQEGEGVVFVPLIGRYGWSG